MVSDQLYSRPLKFRAPANVLLRRAQLTLILAVLLPTVLTTPVGIFLLVTQSSRSVMVLAGILALVMRALSHARSLTEAAYEAGFSSSAHLSSTFREMFGLAPSSLIALGVQIEAGRAVDATAQSAPPAR